MNTQKPSHILGESTSSERWLKNFATFITAEKNSQIFLNDDTCAKIAKHINAVLKKLDSKKSKKEPK